MNSKSREDYLRAIFRLGEMNDTVQSRDIVNYLEVSKPAVSEMLKKLKRQGYVEMTPYSNIALTSEGLQEAKKVTYKHRVAEIFLKEVLNFEGDIHEEAHKMEHSLSDEVAKSLADFLKNPKYCPCGHEIPNIF
jgi:DtxR family transcriptional regulator, Mn-dependent transcriptional regulator